MKIDEKPENPPAFPGNDGYNACNPAFQGGMTLRDYFAASALQGLMVNGGIVGKAIVNGKELPLDIAAYYMADCMLRERLK